MWPSPLERFKRLKEAVQIIKKLWTEDGCHLNVNVIG
jgi:alkanesulfonate monooxygenase SsuD/methylene tetrahydromethanopterin reductase-like flavin-dependent oxidoreductase (luciferase family)